MVLGISLTLLRPQFWLTFSTKTSSELGNKLSRTLVLNYYQMVEMRFIHREKMVDCAFVQEETNFEQLDNAI